MEQLCKIAEQRIYVVLFKNFWLYECFLQNIVLLGLTYCYNATGGRPLSKYEGIKGSVGDCLNTCAGYKYMAPTCPRGNVIECFCGNSIQAGARIM